MNTITLATLHEATAQQVFDQAARHLLTQDMKSILDGFCAYRGDGGCKCVAGCFMADDEYRPSFERKSWSSLVEHGRVPASHLDLICQLQRLHDASPPLEWHFELWQLAERNNLSPAVLTEFAP